MVEMAEELLQAIIDPLRDDLARVDTLITQVLARSEAPVDAMLRYSLTGGKRLRPAFVILTGRLLKTGGRRLHVLAAAVEVLHSATLIHDDVIDNASQRRGRATINSAWTSGAAVLAGDYLLARSVGLIAGLGDPRILEVLAWALHTMSSGEIIAHYAPSSRPDRTAYFRAIEAKTAALFAAAGRMVGLVAGCPDRALAALDRFGREFGIAYQIVDDVLDYAGTGRDLGKPVASDLKQGVITLPVICYLEKGGEAGLIDRIISGKGNAKDLARAVRAIRASGALDEALEVARRHAQKSKAALCRLPGIGKRQTGVRPRQAGAGVRQAGALQDLCDLIDYIVTRRR